MPKVFVGLSGGVDSSVAAALLKKADYEVSGVFMRFWQDARLSRANPCCSPEAEIRARLVAKALKIPFYVFDFKKEFKKAVVDYFLKQTRLGLTPNPCVVCNEEIKFGLFLRKALAMGADFIATGHYARIIARGHGFILFKAKDSQKDQSYFLWRLTQKQLSRVLLPIGEYTKNEVRKLAQKFNLPTAKTKDSQNLCFLASDPQSFLKKNLGLKPGPVVEQVHYGVKKIIGRHPGLGFFTIGQRQGIVPYLDSRWRSNGPYFVLRKNLEANQLFVTRNEKDLLSKELRISDINWIFGSEPRFPLKVKAKIRSRQAEMPATVFKGKKKSEVLVKFAKPERAVTPGQSTVFYKGEELLGGGIIN